MKWNLRINAYVLILVANMGAVSGAASQNIASSEFIFTSAPFASCHASTVVETKSGHLLAAWFGGTGEGHPDVGIWLSRQVKGQWTAPVEVANGLQADGTRQPCWNPVLFQPKDGPLMLFYKVGPSPPTWWGLLRTSRDDGQSWSPARRLPDGILGPIKNKPVQLANGDILCPTSSEDHGWRVYFESSRNGGRTWTATSPVNDGKAIAAIQPSILLHGDRLQAMGRTQQGKVFEVWSDDGGKTWGTMALTALPNPNSGTDAVTLRGGQHLLVYNHTPRGRTPLNVALSPDGKQWQTALVLEDEPGEYSYPAVIQTRDGLVHITYTWKRQRIKHVVLDPWKSPFRTANEDILSQADVLETQGQFKEAAGLLAKVLSGKELSVSQRKMFEFELDRLERIKKCFPHTEADLLHALRESVAGLTAEEFEQWVKEGRFDSRQIDGQRRFMAASVSNLFFRYPELKPRRQPRKDTATLEKHRWETCRSIKTAALDQKAPYVLPKRFQAAMTVTAAAGVVPGGEIVRAWLPVPRIYPYQNGFKVLSASPAVTRIDDPACPIRCVYLEQAAGAGQPVEFKVQYEYTRYGVYFDLRPEAGTSSEAQPPSLREFLREGPHVVFTPEMRELSRQIVGRETHACRKAKMIYDWIADRIKYSYSIEYSTIRNLSDYCRSKGYGDCGQEALLFITLCRLNSIPARWQSGWNTFPGAKDIHDWSEIHIPPYGWVPVDPYMGVFAMRYATTLSREQRRELRDFYFGGLDQYRMAANSDHCQTLTPAKRSMRSDNVDFQRGELEHGSQNVYFDEYSYELILKEL